MAKIEIKLEDGGYLAALGAMKSEKAAALARATFPRVGRDVRSELVASVRRRWPKIPKKAALARITIDKAKSRFRIYGAGPKKGKMFVRPRWLGLQAKIPAWTGTQRFAPKRAFAATPLTGSKASRGGKAKAGRNFALANARTVSNFSKLNKRTGKWEQKKKELFVKHRGFTIKKAVVFQRITGSRKVGVIAGPDSMGDLVSNVASVEWIKNELNRRMAAEAKRKLDARIQTATRRKSRQRA